MAKLIGKEPLLTALFPPGKGGGEGVDYGHKGKGVTQHLLTERNGMPLAIISTSARHSEQAEVINLLAQVKIFGKRQGRPRSCPDIIEADKGYDSQKLREKLRAKGIQPIIPRRVWKNRRQRPGRKPPKLTERFKVERCFAWIQKKFRRLCIKWERRWCYWRGFIQIGVAWMWLTRLVS